MVVQLKQNHFDEIVAHARAENPRECCGLIGGSEDGSVSTVYRTRNVAPKPLITYEAAPEDLFAAQRSMRKAGERLLAIYHSHPRADKPEPSETDVKLAYYPSAVYFIVGLGSEQPSLRAFQISERSRLWEEIEYEIIPDT